MLKYLGCFLFVDEDVDLVAAVDQYEDVETACSDFIRRTFARQDARLAKTSHGNIFHNENDAGMCTAIAEGAAFYDGWTDGLDGSTRIAPYSMGAFESE